MGLACSKMSIMGDVIVERSNSPQKNSKSEMVVSLYIYRVIMPFN